MFANPAHYADDVLVLVMTAIIFFASVHLFKKGKGKGQRQTSATHTDIQEPNYVVDPILSQTGYLPSYVGPNSIPIFGCVDVHGNPPGYLPPLLND